MEALGKQLAGKLGIAGKGRSSKRRVASKKTTSKKAEDAQTKTAERFFTGYESFVALGKDNMDAAMKSSTIMAQGFEELSTLFFSLARANMEEGMKLSKTLMSCKTPEEFFEVQSVVAKSSYEKALDESRKISDISVKLAEKAGKPLAEQVNASVEVISKSLAA